MKMVTRRVEAVEGSTIELLGSSQAYEREKVLTAERMSDDSGREEQQRR